MRGTIERDVGHRIKDALWASVLGLAIASGTALASGPGPGGLTPGSGSIGGPAVAPPRDIAIPMPPPIDLPDALPVEDVTAHRPDDDPAGVESVDVWDDDELASLLEDDVNDLVSQDSDGASPGGGGGALPPLPSGSMSNGGACIFALLGEAGVDPGDRIRQCIEEHGSHSPSYPPELDGNEFSLPASNCEEDPPESATDAAESAMDAAAKKAEKAAKEAKQAERAAKAFAIAEKSTGATKEFYSKLGAAELAGAGLGVGYKAEKVGNSYVVTFAKGIGGGTYIVGGGTVLEIESTDPPVNLTLPVKKPGGSSRPVGPGSGPCDPEGEKARAEALANCIFSGTKATAVAGPGAASMNPMLTPRMPEECNGVDIPAFWGSSNEDEGGAFDPPPWALSKGGPTVMPTFIPGVSGGPGGGGWTDEPRPIF